MDTGNKILIFIFLGIFTHRILYSQEIMCCKPNEFEREADLLVAIKDYISNDPVTNCIILADFCKVDSISLLRIVGSDEIFEIFFKKPDCYFMYNKNIVYLFTDSYAQEKDSVWLEMVFCRTRDVLHYPNISVKWRNDSIIKVDKPVLAGRIYSPVILEYQVYNGEILKKGFCRKMLYPDTSKPKGVKVFR